MQVLATLFALWLGVYVGKGLTGEEAQMLRSLQRASVLPEDEFVLERGTGWGGFHAETCSCWERKLWSPPAGVG